MMNTWIERPALEARQLFWLAALHRISGMLYYSVDMWSFQCPEFRQGDVAGTAADIGGIGEFAVRTEGRWHGAGVGQRCGHDIGGGVQVAL